MYRSCCTIYRAAVTRDRVPRAKSITEIDNENDRHKDGAFGRDGGGAAVPRRNCVRAAISRGASVVWGGGPFQDRPLPVLRRSADHRRDHRERLERRQVIRSSRFETTFR